MKKQWVNRLIDELKKPLPGIEAQLRLSPPVRLHNVKTKTPRRSAVLILLYPKDSKPYIVFIKRGEYKGVHSGQISLPGGMYKKTDRILRQTALRETMEETGVIENQVEIIGNLTPLHIPISNFNVYPFVGYCLDRPVFKPDPFEVKYIIEAALNELLDTENQKHKLMHIGGNEIEIPYFDLHGDHLWGATAMIISEFLEVVKKI
jgi:8-oxo-dGTP pyrophosphatase MutT (NUDIX family)